MAPPSFAELGRATSNVFNKSYPLGVFRFDGYMQSPGNGSLATSASMKLNEWNLDSGLINCSYLLNPEWLRTSVCQSWDLDNKLRCAITNTDGSGYVPGLRVCASGAVNPETGDCSGKISQRYKSPYVTIDASIEGGGAEMKTTGIGSIVTGYGGWVAGAKGNYNVDEGTVAGTTFAVGRVGSTFQCLGFWDDMEKVRVALYQRINDRVEAGMTVRWKAGTAPAKDDKGESGQLQPSSETETEMALGAKFLLTPYTSLQTKINTDSAIGISIESEIRSGN